MSVERARRWPPRQRIHLTAEGREALSGYQALVQEARASNLNAAAMEGRLSAWAGALGIRPSDGVLLEEISSKVLSVNELARAVESCGQRANEVKAGVDRLYGAGLVQPPEVAVEPPPSYVPPNPWR